MERAFKFQLKFMIDYSVPSPSGREVRRVKGVPIVLQIAL